MVRFCFILTAVFGLSVVAVGAETKLTSDQITAALTEKSLYAGGDKEQIFQKGGLTFYLTRGNSSQGFWKVENDAYCSQWPPNKSWACYDVMQDGSTITFVSSDGTRYPMTTKRP